MKAKKQNLTAWIARILVLTLFIGVLVPFGATDVWAASNKGLSMKVTFDGKKNWDANTYTMYATYKKTTKVQSGMKTTQTVYIPTSALKKNDDEVDISTFLAVNDKKGNFVGDIWSYYAVILRKVNGKVECVLWNNAKEKEQSAKNMVTLKKSGKYYVVTIKNMNYQSKMWGDDGKFQKVATYKKTSYVAHAVYITGLCSKTKNAVVYSDNLSLKNGSSTQKITFDKKDYSTLWGWCGKTDKEYKVSVKAIKTK